jgi:hypothetical protein
VKIFVRLASLDYLVHQIIKASVKFVFLDIMLHLELLPLVRLANQDHFLNLKDPLLVRFVNQEVMDLNMEVSIDRSVENVQKEDTVKVTHVVEIVL